MIGYYHIKPKSPVAMDAIVRHGDIMGVDKQDRDEVLLWCATPTCPCWKTHRYRKWFRLHYDVILGSEVTNMAAIEEDLNRAVSVN